MTGDQWLAVMIAIAVALLLILLLLIAALVIRRPKAQLAAAYQRFSSSDALPVRNRTLRRRLLVLSVLVVLNAVCLGILLSRTPGELAEESTSTQNAPPGGILPSAGPSSASDPRNGSPEERTIQLEDVADSAGPFQAVRIQGTYHGGAERLLRVQRWEGGKWLGFPVPMKTDQSGYFATHVEFGKPGRYSVRVWDADSGTTSKPFVLVIKE
jgi:preprotein translocase subunit SecG